MGINTEKEGKGGMEVMEDKKRQDRRSDTQADREKDRECQRPICPEGEREIQMKSTPKAKQRRQQ